MNTIVAMLIWVGSAHGGPTILTGFETLEACNRARPELIRSMSTISGAILSNSINSTTCVALPTR
jgi:hypothetical protein